MDQPHISVLSAAEYVQATPIDGKDAYQLFKALNGHISFAKRRGITVSTVFCDGEASIQSDEFKSWFSLMDIQVEQVDIDPNLLIWRPTVRRVLYGRVPCRG